MNETFAGTKILSGFDVFKRIKYALSDLYVNYNEAPLAIIN